MLKDNQMIIVNDPIYILELVVRLAEAVAKCKTEEFEKVVTESLHQHNHPMQFIDAILKERSEQ